MLKLRNRSLYKLATEKVQRDVDSVAMDGRICCHVLLSSRLQVEL